MTIPSENNSHDETKVGLMARTQFYVSLWYNKLLAQTLSPLSGWTWWNRVDDTVIIGALPEESFVRELKKTENLKYVINMCREFDELSQLYKELDIIQLRLETEDFTLPTFENLTAGVKYIENCVKNCDGTVYVHCKAGRGRSATLVLCYLLNQYDLNPEQAQNVLIQTRAQVDKHIYKATVVQEIYDQILDRGIKRISYEWHK